MSFLIKCVGLVAMFFLGLHFAFAAESSVAAKNPIKANKLISDINVTNAFFYVPLGGSKTTMAFFTISNNANSDITITGVSSASAKHIRLMPAGTLLVPAHQSVALKASGQYLQITDLKTKLSTGDELHLTVSLSNGQKLQLIALAKSAYDQVHGH